MLQDFSAADRTGTCADAVFLAGINMQMGAISLSQTSPKISVVADKNGAYTANYKIFETMSAIDASKAGILIDYNVTFEPGQNVACVGASEGGKSSLLSLLECFYEPQQGVILLNEGDVKTL
ncbi:hypothetical protein PI124_g16227 [Phytophthora idaei]|nr:hypothetical protein PI124_g16227 [Phytophthora idaei]